MIIQVVAQSSLLMVLYMGLMFVIAQIKKDNSIVDIAWGMGYILIALYSLFKNGLFLPRQLLVTFLVILWGLRISGYLFIRNYGKGEDPRYTKMKQHWGKYMPLYSFFIVFMLQGFLILVISYPVMLVNNSSNPGLNLLDIIGATVWLFGFLCESIGDIQLYLFLKKSENKGKVFQLGLWKYTRHPNYFGEMLLWWGIWLISLSVPLGWSGIISPLTVTYLLIFVSGIPMTEQQMASLQGFDEYKRRTSILIPWFPKS